MSAHQRELTKTTESVPQCVGLVHVCEIMGVGREKRRLKKHKLHVYVLSHIHTIKLT